MTDRPDPSPTQVRVAALVSLVAELLFLAWVTWGDWRIAVPALLLVHLIGLVGFGLYWMLARHWRQHITHEEIIVASGLFSALIVGGVTLIWGEWMGLRSILGSMTAGLVVGITLVLGRLALWGPISKDSATGGKIGG